ncbi:hypothetical protein EDD86DRAFT_271605 [Gorgonomyces haynaldii]|nr:hypothetical protein EDD86DRAFT_271605 [Gorgonomyces haynaldii]
MTVDRSLETEEPMMVHQYNRKSLESWIYPVNYPERAYQFNIVQKALTKNTLVCLPTGLGKTFLAAVVMYNYLRWFPESKIVFMAPTKPLVAQQVKACYEIVGIPQDITIEMNGAIATEKRQQEWKNKQCFFLTPQILNNDLKSGICPWQSIVLLVIDEAHRATGQYAYCEAIRELLKHNSPFRVLALSATPGSDMKVVQNVVENLLIQNVEIRTEESLDIRPFIHKRSIEEIVVEPTDYMSEILKQYGKVVQPVLDDLKRKGALHNTNLESLSPYYLLNQKERWIAQNSNAAPSLRGAVIGGYMMAHNLVRIYALLQSHGIAVFHKALTDMLGEPNDGTKKSFAKQNLSKDQALLSIVNSLPLRMKSPTFVSHPKIERLVAIVVEHFVNLQEDNQRQLDAGLPEEQSRVMIFSTFRESVDEIVRHLDFHKPMVRSMAFIGQGKLKGKKGLNQKEQLQLIADFKQGDYNVLVATSIGEEGLDIGEVDLIVCFDAQSSPLRMLQRMGRTGRKRKGRVVTLLAKGKEQDSYHTANQKYKNVQRGITDGNKRLIMYNGPHALKLPVEAKPTVEKRVMEIKAYEDTKPKKKPKKKEVKKTILKGIESESSDDEFLKMKIPSADRALQALNVGEPVTEKTLVQKAKQLMQQVQSNGSLSALKKPKTGLNDKPVTPHPSVAQSTLSAGQSTTAAAPSALGLAHTTLRVSKSLSSLTQHMAGESLTEDVAMTNAVDSPDIMDTHDLIKISQLMQLCDDDIVEAFESSDIDPKYYPCMPNPYYPKQQDISTPERSIPQVLHSIDRTPLINPRQPIRQLADTTGLMDRQEITPIIQRPGQTIPEISQSSQQTPSVQSKPCEKPLILEAPKENLPPVKQKKNQSKITDFFSRPKPDIQHPVVNPSVKETSVKTVGLKETEIKMPEPKTGQRISTPLDALKENQSVSAIVQPKIERKPSLTADDFEDAFDDIDWDQVDMMSHEMMTLDKDFMDSPNLSAIHVRDSFESPKQSIKFESPKQSVQSIKFDSPKQSNSVKMDDSPKTIIRVEDSFESPCKSFTVQESPQQKMQDLHQLKETPKFETVRPVKRESMRQPDDDLFSDPNEFDDTDLAELAAVLSTVEHEIVPDTPFGKQPTNRIMDTSENHAINELVKTRSRELQDNQIPRTLSLEKLQRSNSLAKKSVFNASVGANHIRIQTQDDSPIIKRDRNKRQVIESSSPRPQPKKKKRPDPETIGQFIDLEAELSSDGGPVSADETDGEEDEAMKQFINTQSSEGAEIYHHNLLTPVQQGRYKFKMVQPMSDETPIKHDSETDESMKDFVCDDDEIEYMTQFNLPSSGSERKPWQSRKKKINVDTLDHDDLDDLIDFE